MSGGESSASETRCSTALGLESTTDFFIIASLLLLSIAVLSLSTFDFTQSYNGPKLYVMISVMFAGIMYFMAAIFLRTRVTGNDNDTYKTILKENYDYTNDNDDKKDSRSMITLCCTANSYLVVAWLIFLGTLPLACPLASDSVPIYSFVIVLVALAVLIYFIVAASPQCLKMNHGKGSVFCTAGIQCYRPFSSDVLIVLFLLSLIGMALIVSSVFNVVPNVTSVTAWLWLATSIMFTVGMFLFHYFSIVDDNEKDDDEATVHMLPPTRV